MKNNLGIRNMKICPHAIRVIEKDFNIRSLRNSKEQLPSPPASALAKPPATAPAVGTVADEEVEKP